MAKRGGANDPRVLEVESDEIVAAAKKKGVPVEYMVLLAERHLTRRLFRAMLQRIWALPVPTA